MNGARNSSARREGLLSTAGRWPATVAVAAVIFLLSEIPPSLLPESPRLPHADKLVHLALYLVLGALLFRSLGHDLYARPRLAAIISWVSGAGFGALDEWHQGFTGRCPDGVDFLADVTGLTLGTVLVSLVRKWRGQNGG